MVKTTEYRHISLWEIKQTLSELKKHFGTEKFTYWQAQQKLPEVNKLRLLSIFRKSKVRGLISVTGQIRTEVGENQGWVNLYVIK